MGMHSMIWGGVCFLALIFIQRIRSRVRLRRRFNRARRAEKSAESLLRRHGYSVLAQQPVAHSRVQVGDKVISTPIRADYLVRRGLRCYVVEVKSGKIAPNPQFRNTRRQLREYCDVYPYDVLLVDPAEGKIRLIEFLDQSSSWSLILRTWICRLLILGAVWFLFDLLGYAKVR